jgi:hypothetical protein
MGIFNLSRRRALLKPQKKTAPVIAILPFLYNPKQRYGRNNYRETEKEIAATRYSILQGEKHKKQVQMVNLRCDRVANSIRLRSLYTVPWLT